MRVMIIDDDVEIVESLKTALERINYVCDGFTDPVLALKNYKKESCYDVVITDIRMGDVSGFEVIDEILNHNSDAKIIVVSAYEDFELSENDFKESVAAFYKKPVEFVDLLKRLETLNY